MSKYCRTREGLHLQDIHYHRLLFAKYDFELEQQLVNQVRGYVGDLQPEARSQL